MTQNPDPSKKTKKSDYIKMKKELPHGTKIHKQKQKKNWVRYLQLVPETKELNTQIYK